jgi:dTDP-glucose 4,6-dehydratase
MDNSFTNFGDCMKNKVIAISGVLGFIFSNFIRWAVKEYPDTTFIGIDNAIERECLLNAFSHPNYRFYLNDIANEHMIQTIFELEMPDILIHGAAESFVDNSITDISPFLHSNVIGTQSLINVCLKTHTKMLYISTDEVYGQIANLSDTTSWTEEQPLNPRNPYAASKACGEMIVRAAGETHGLQYWITRSANTMGPRQKERNLIPKIISCLLNNKPIPIHGDGKNVREFIYVNDAIRAIMNVVEKGNLGEAYNIGSDHHSSNLETVDYIANYLGMKPDIQFVADRKGHDKKYSVCSDKIRALGWKPNETFASGMKKTIDWYVKQYKEKC